MGSRSTTNPPTRAAVPQALGAVTLIVAFAALLGWILDIAWLRTSGGIGSAMNPGSAAILLSGGASLWVASSERDRLRQLGPLFAGVVLVLAMARLGELAFGWPTGVDRFLVPGRFAGVPEDSPIRISGGMAILYIVAGVGLILAGRPERMARIAGRAVATFLAVIAAVAVLAFLATIGSARAAAPKAVNTTVLLLALSVGTAWLAGIREPEEQTEEVRALRGRVTLTIRVAIALLVTTSVLSVWGAARSQDAAASRRAADVWRDALNDLIGTVQNAESNQRGYLLTGDSLLAQRYRVSADSVATKVAAMDRLPGSGGGQAGQMMTLRRHLDAKLTELALTVELQGRGQADSALRIVRSGTGIVAMRGIRDAANGLIAERTLEVARWDERLQLDSRVSVGMSLLGGVLAILFLSIAGSTIGRDLEARAGIERALRASEARLNQVVRLIPNMVFLKDPETLRFTLFNRAGTELLGYSEDQIVGRDSRELFPKEESDRSEAIDRAVLQSTEVREQLEEVVHTRTGEERILHTKRVAGRDASGKPLFILGIGEDITERIAAQAAVREAKESAERANRAKSEFLAKMSHELRTPLNAIIGFSEIVADGAAGPLTDKQRRYVGNVLVSGRNLLQLINDILDLSKVEAGRMELALTTFEVRPALEQISTILETIAAKKAITLHVDVPEHLPPITADRGKVAQVMFNLVGNALKFTPGHGRVTIRARVVPAAGAAEGNELVVGVSDTGVGIPAEDLGRIFGEFEQVSRAVESTPEGTGLGLAVAKRLIELHGGRIWVDSVVGEGTTFSFALPVRGTTAGVTGKENGPLILVVDDEPQARDLLTHYLRESGFRVAATSNSLEAVALATELRPAAITLDVLMPNRDGFDVLAALKGTDATRDIPVVVVSVTDRSELGFSLGAADWLVKPVPAPALLASLRRVIGTETAQGRTLLLIEDHRETVEYLDGILEQEGYGVASADTGWGGVELAVKRRPDAIILDLMLPDLNGFDVARLLRSHPDVGHVPILVLTAKDLTAEEEASLRRTAQVVMRKGGRDELVNELRRLFAPAGR